MKKILPLFMACAFGLLPFSAAEARSCDAMQGMSKTSSCCASGACDCSMKTAPSKDASVPQATQNFSPANKHFQAAYEAAGLSPAAACVCRRSAAESPSPPPKPYQLTSQYRL